jgi:predicted outer membrane repeat protein
LWVSGTIHATGVDFVGNSSVSNGGAIWALGANITETAFTGNACTGFCSGGGIFASGTLTLTDSVFAGNSSANHGGGAAALTHAEVRGGHFENNTSHTSGYGGGGLIAFNTATLSGTQFISNSAEYYGGGLYAYYTATLTNTSFISNSGLLPNSVGGGATLLRAARISGAQFTGNQAASVGGLYVGRDGTVQDTQFLANVATLQSAGGMRADSHLTLTNVSFVGNQSVSCGGGLLTFSTTVQLRVQDSEFIQNTVSNTSGGGLCSYSAAILTNTRVLSNEAQMGGGIFSVAPIEVHGGRFQGNRAVSYGGGLYSLFGTSLLSGVELINNHATHGGGLYVWLDASHVVNSLLAGNTATSGQGHALFADQPEKVTIVHTTIATPSVTAGSAIYLSGTLQSGVSNTILANYDIGLQALSGAVMEDYNLFSGVTTPTLGATGGAHDVLGNPNFLAPLAGNYHLGPGSAAVDKAAPGTGVLVDFDGQPRPFGILPDIGYDESGELYVLYLTVIRRELFTSGLLAGPATGRR